MTEESLWNKSSIILLEYMRTVSKRNFLSDTTCTSLREGHTDRCMALTSYSWEKRRPSLAFSRSMWSAISVTGMGGCSFIPARGRGGRGREGKKNKRKEWDPAGPTSNIHMDLDKHCLDHRVSDAASGTMRWLWKGEESALCSTMHEESEGRAREER